MRRQLVATVLGAALAASPALAQEQPEPLPEVATGRAAAKNDPDIPVSLDRIRRGLAAQPRTREVKNGLRLEYYIDVFGKSPELKLFAPETKLTNAPVMYGGMTHQEFLQVVTPEEFRAPAADIPGAIAALIKWAVEKNKNSSPKR
jgi:hypothetical protein